MTASLAQCWFCHNLNITVPNEPTPCRTCGVLPKEARPDTSPVVMSPQESSALTTQLAAPALRAPASAGALPPQSDNLGNVAPWLAAQHPATPLPPTSGAPATPAPDVRDVAPLATSGAESPKTTQWVIETEAGDMVPLLGSDFTVGRQPKATSDSVPLALNDTTRTLSKTHARLRYDATRSTWTVEDLASTNGVVTLIDDVEQPVAPHVATPFQEYLSFGMLRCRVIYL